MPETVDIISERRVPLPTGPAGGREFVRIVYRAAGQLPRQVLVDSLHDSPEERARLIAEDLRAARQGERSTLVLPEEAGERPPGAA